MSHSLNLKQTVIDKYAQIAQKSSKQNQASCCSPAVKTCCEHENSDYSMLNDDYSQLAGYVPEADLNLGCGLPTQYAGIKPGDTVVDLGSGAGNDVFVARSIVTENGKVIGIDMTPEMIDKARTNNKKLGYENIEFRLAEIEKLPLDDNSTDVVISNCVLNLVPDKYEAFAEIYRILKKGAHFCISDIVTNGPLTERMQRSAELYAGCVAGAMQEEEYLAIIKKIGFKNVQVKTKQKIVLPESMVQNYLNEDDLTYLKHNHIGIFSITVVGYKA